MTKPLWLLDVDGVLNAVCRDIPDGHQRTRCDSFWITYNPNIIKEIVNLHESGAVEVRWLTTWCDRAATVIAPAIGLPLDLKVEGAKDYKQENHQVWWKSITAKRLSDEDPHRPLIWTDDDIAYANRYGDIDWVKDRPGPMMLIASEWEVGLTEEHLDEILNFVSEHQGS